jgi:flagellar basal body rod protein FlgG
MLKYHSVQPENFKTEYVETDIIDFVLSFPADKIESGSIRVNADIKLVDNEGNQINDIITKKVFLNGLCGSHAFFDTINCSSNNMGNVETLSYYNRLQSTKAVASLTQQTIFNSEYICELRAPDELVAGNMLKGVNEYALAVAGTTALQTDTISTDF